MNRVVHPCADHADGPTTGYMVMCPACGNGHKFNTEPGPNGVGGNNPCWTFNGDMERPTFSPSMHVTTGSAPKDWMPIMKSIQLKTGEEPARIPWEMMEPHAEQARRNHNQSLERLKQRGGLSTCEALAIMDDRDWAKMDSREAAAELSRRVQSWYKTAPDRVCHSFVTDGNIQFLSDCTHSLAGQTVPLEAW